jgi:hypothetical protein
VGTVGVLGEGRNASASPTSSDASSFASPSLSSTLMRFMPNLPASRRSVTLHICRYILSFLYRSCRLTNKSSSSSSELISQSEPLLLELLVSRDGGFRGDEECGADMFKDDESEAALKSFRDAIYDVEETLERCCESMSL